MFFTEELVRISCAHIFRKPFTTKPTTSPYHFSLLELDDFAAFMGGSWFV
jgi:hypothetical protein